MHNQVFQLVSPSNMALLSMLAVLLGLVAILWLLLHKPLPRIARMISMSLVSVIALVFLWVGGRSLDADIEVNLAEVSVNIPLYGRDIARTDILPAGVRQLNLADEPEFAMKIRRNGFGLPQFQLGWFALENGRQAVVFITDPNNLVLIPTKDNYMVIVSSDDPQGLVNAF